MVAVEVGGHAGCYGNQTLDLAHLLHFRTVVFGDDEALREVGEDSLQDTKTS